MQTPAFRWTRLSPDDSEELRGSKCIAWAQEAWGHADKQGSKWKHISAQPVNPHVHDEPIYMWLEQRGLHWRRGLTGEDIWYEPHHTYSEDGKEVIVFTRLPCSPEKAQRIRKARSMVDGHRIAYHGTISYAVPNIAANQFIASDNVDLGHRTLGSETGENLTGVYVTPVEVTALGYATPQIMFRDHDAGAEDEGQTGLALSLKSLSMWIGGLARTSRVQTRTTSSGCSQRIMLKL